MEGLVYTVIVGLVAGWLAGQVMNPMIFLLFLNLVRKAYLGARPF